MKTKLVLLTLTAALALSAPFAHSMEKTTVEKHKEFLVQQKEPSNVMRWVNKFAGKFVLDYYPSKPTNPFYQQLWKKAQNDLNIPEQYHAPIVAFDHEKNNLCSGDNMVTAARMRYNMYVNDEANPINDSLSYFNHYHEAAHHKYLDAFSAWKREMFFNISNVVLASCSGLGLSFCSLYTSAKINPKIASLLCRFPITTFFTSYIITYPSSLVLTGYTISPLINKNLEKYSQLHERRADLEAAYALKCDQCVQATADNRENCSPKDQELLGKAGYVSWQELEAIAQEHKKNGHVCDYHKKSH